MVFPRRPLGVVFDMDGVLFDTESLYRDATIEAAASLGHDMPVSLFHSLIGLPHALSEPLVQAHFGGRIDVSALWSDAKRRFFERVGNGPPLKEGVLDLLGLLDRHNVPRAIATSSKRTTVDHHLAALGLTDRFPIVVADGDYARGKPHPDPYLLATQRLGLRPADCLALEDSYNGVRSAAAAGLMTVMVPDLLAPSDEMRQLCVVIASNLASVAAHLSAA